MQPGLAVEMRSKVLKLQEEMHKAEVGSHSWLAEVPCILKMY